MAWQSSARLVTAACFIVFYCSTISTNQVTNMIAAVAVLLTVTVGALYARIYAYFKLTVALDHRGRWRNPTWWEIVCFILYLVVIGCGILWILILWPLPVFKELKNAKKYPVLFLLPCALSVIVFLYACISYVFHNYPTSVYASYRFIDRFKTIRFLDYLLWKVKKEYEAEVKMEKDDIAKESEEELEILRAATEV